MAKKKQQRIHRNKYQVQAQEARLQRIRDERKVRKWRECTRKQRYETFEDAKGSGYWEAYQCQHCGKWHRSSPTIHRMKRYMRSFNLFWGDRAK